MLRDDALRYHAEGRPGKIAVVPTKPLANQRDLALAYSPGVAEPCLAIKENPNDVYTYTAKGNLVAVVTNGTAVLGLGDIGALAGKPVMEGKANLFKQFADLDVFDLEVGSREPDDLIKFCELLEPTVGGINLEDIKAPDCFYIEQTLRDRLNIPVFHDDQHGTAIISGAALLNAMELVEKPLDQITVVFSGAGAAALATAEHYVRLGVRRERIWMADVDGLVYEGRTIGQMDRYKARFAHPTHMRTVAEALDGADLYVGLSVARALKPEWVAKMAPRPVIFALANPVPEILPDEVRAVRDDAIVATGRSDYPNQVNNVLGFPFIFRGALDARATTVNEEMKMAATRALALLAREDVPDSVARLYGRSDVQFGPEYLIPFPFDPRVLLWVAPAVAWAAVASGVARVPFVDVEAYREQLEHRLGRARGLLRSIVTRAAADPRRVAFPDGDEPRILRAARILVDEGIAEPILVGSRAAIEESASLTGISLDGMMIEDVQASPRRDSYMESLWQRRQRKGLSRAEAHRRLSNPTWFGACMVAAGDADALVAGVRAHFPEAIRPALEAIGTNQKAGVLSGMHLLVFEKRVVFCADTTVNLNPTAEQLAQITLAAARLVRHFGIEPRIALLSYSNFGSVRSPEAELVSRAVQLVRERAPELEVDGEMQADTAVDAQVLREHYPFAHLKEPANVLIFPTLAAGNIAYKLLSKLGAATAIGPILVGMRKPVHVLEQGADVEAIVNMAAVAVMDAQDRGTSAPHQRKQSPGAFERGPLALPVRG
jgi:malate dehydrogenase (oxaloacetate-decarboxylating)(NADP+)